MLSVEQMEDTMDVILVGPPGAGKGTQATVLEEKTGLTHIASGELLRHHMREETKLGVLARSYVDRGALVPDNVVIRMILERVLQPDCEAGVILDGFPRTIDQAHALMKALQERGRTIDAVILLNAPRDVLLKRIVGRQTCRTCQISYNLYYAASHKAGICDACGDSLYTRSDDTIQTARQRLEIYFQQTMPLIEHYRTIGLLHEVDGLGNIHEVTRRLVQKLGLPNGASDRAQLALG